MGKLWYYSINIIQLSMITSRCLCLPNIGFWILETWQWSLCHYQRSPAEEQPGLPQRAGTAQWPNFVKQQDSKSPSLSQERNTKGTLFSQRIRNIKSLYLLFMWHHNFWSDSMHSPRRDFSAILREAKRPINRDTRSCKSKPQETATSGRP